MQKILKVSLSILLIGIVFVLIKIWQDKPQFSLEKYNAKNNIVIPIQPKTDIIQPNKENETPRKPSLILGLVEWEGTDPYKGSDWSGANPELKVAVEDFEKKWGKKLSIRQIYRPAEYGKHLRSVWEIWRYMNGKSYIEGYKCEEYTHINPKLIGKLNQNQKDYINKEAIRHAFASGDTPPGCVSDHAKGIAIDITPPFEPKEYMRFIEVAHSVGLCHYIKGDEPHFGLTAQLPEGTDCFVK